jgi:hypothetical protein
VGQALEQIADVGEGVDAVAMAGVVQGTSRYADLLGDGTSACL